MSATTFIATKVREIDEELRVLREESGRLEAARTALMAVPHRGGASVRVRRGHQRPSRQTIPGDDTRLRELLEAVERRGPSTVTELTKDLGWALAEVRAKLIRLRREGRVTYAGAPERLWSAKA